VDAEHDRRGRRGERASDVQVCVLTAKARKTAIGLSGHGFPETENENTETKKTDRSLENIHHMIFFAFCQGGWD
jgi:hypothetical protein